MPPPLQVPVIDKGDPLVMRYEGMLRVFSPDSCVPWCRTRPSSAWVISGSNKITQPIRLVHQALNTD